MFVFYVDEVVRGLIYVVNDFMRRIFLISVGIVVVFYYFVWNDMIEVRGDDEDLLWKVFVFVFSMRWRIVIV